MEGGDTVQMSRRKYMLHGNERLCYARTMWVTFYLPAYLTNLGHIYSYPNKKQSYYYITIEVETQVGNFCKVTFYKSRADIHTHICLT